MKIAAVVILAVVGPSFAPQDPEWVQAWERAQQSRPARLASDARIAAQHEPGTPLIIGGRVFREDGRTPAPGITVFAYHTDARGLYDVPEAGPHSWRLKGWAITDGDGRFRFRTIRPASYPNATVPQHVHLTIDGPNVPRRWTTELEFDDDPKITGRQRQESRASGMFGGVRPVTRRNGVDLVEINLKLENRGLF